RCLMGRGEGEGRLRHRVGIEQTERDLRLRCVATRPYSPSPCPLPLWGRGRVESAPASLRFLEAGAAVDEGQVPRPARASLVRGRLVKVEGGRIESDPVVLEGAVDRDEAARHVGAHALGITLQRIAPATPAARLEADEITQVDDH